MAGAILAYISTLTVQHSIYPSVRGNNNLDTHYIIESEIAVIFLSVILCVYLQLIYSGSSSEKKGLLRYCYMTTASSIIDVFYSIVLAPNSGYPLMAQYICSVIWQIAACGVYFMFMRYIAGFGPDSPFKRKMLYAQNIVLGAFFYLQMIAFFTKTNYTVSPDGMHLITGDLWNLLTITYLWIW